MLEIIIVGIVVLFIITYRSSVGEGVYKFISSNVNSIYDKYAPYSYKEMRKKIKKMGLDFTPKDYLIRVVLIGGLAAAIGYLYFYCLFCSCNGFYSLFSIFKFKKKI